MRAYKCFDKNLKCRDFQFEIGKTYEHVDELKMCKSGFHFCEKPMHLFKYYEFDESTRVCEVECSGEITRGDDKSVCSKITIIRELSWHEVLELVNTGIGNTGLGNSGNNNSGGWNSGPRNSGFGNSGRGNSGNENSGHGNSGNENSGRGNSGCGNSGYGNSGDDNSGNGNSGYKSSGHFNSGPYNSGLFNTDEPYLRIFNKPTKLKYYSDEVQELLGICKPVLCEWISAFYMTDSEKERHPEYKTNGGYLKTYKYKEAWKNWWNKAPYKHRRLILDLPNFDADLFKEITGIKVRKKQTRPRRRKS